MFVTVRLKVSETLALLLSVAVTLTATDPTSPFEGVPLKVRVLVSNDSQGGSVFPSSKVAV